MKKKNSVGRPVEKQTPLPIPDTPENIAQSIMQEPPKREWRYIKKHQEKKKGK